MQTDGGCPAHDPRSCPSFLVPRMGRSRHDPGNCHRTVVGMVDVRATALATVIVVFDAAAIKNNSNRDGACPPPPTPQGKEDTPHTAGGRGKDLNLNKGSKLNLLQVSDTDAYQCCFHQRTVLCCSVTAIATVLRIVGG